MKLKEPSKRSSSILKDYDEIFDVIELFIKQLTISMFNKQLYIFFNFQFFDSCKSLTNIRVIRKKNGASRGFAYVSFSEKDDIKKALSLDRQVS